MQDECALRRLLLNGEAVQVDLLPALLYLRLPRGQIPPLRHRAGVFVVKRYVKRAFVIHRQILWE